MDLDAKSACRVLRRDSADPRGMKLGCCRAFLSPQHEWARSV
jgi:hypothetical protein